MREHERREIELQHRVRLSESEARMAEMVESAMDAIIMFDESQHVTLFNAAAERVFGYTAKEAIGTGDRQVLPARVPDRLHRSRVRDRAGARGRVATPHILPRLESAMGVRASGEAFPIECTVSCLELAEGKVYTLIARDISERVRAENELRNQATTLANTTAELKAVNDELARRQGELEQAMTARRRFYASMSHELRTPINAILGYNTLLLDHIYGPLNEKQTQGVRRAHKAAKHLLELVNDVLDLSKIEAGKIELQLQPVPFPTLIEDLFVTVRPLADERGSELALVVRGRAAQDRQRSAARAADPAQPPLERDQVRQRQTDSRRVRLARGWGRAGGRRRPGRRHRARGHPEDLRRVRPAPEDA